MKFVSLFAGIGGFDLALERLGHECVYANDFDKYCKQTYDKHFKLKLDTTDLTRVSTGDIPNHDLLVGGFPCQSFSVAGLRKGFTDTRGTLFFDIARILEAKRPPYLLLENVKGLLSHDTGRTFEVILRTLDELGYDLQWQVCNSKNFGVPQNRERVFIIGHTRGTRRPEVFPFRKNDLVSDNQEGSPRPLVYVGAIMSEKNKAWLDDGKTLSRNFPQGQRVYSADGVSTTLAAQAGGLGAKTGLYTIPVLTPDRFNKRQNGRRFKGDGEPSFTLTAQDRHGVMISKTVRSGGRVSPHGSKHNWDSYEFDGVIRRLTPVECERLQGFPDGWTEGVSDTQRYK